MEINWRKLKKTGDLPTYEILAVNDENNFLVGFFGGDADNLLICESDEETLSHVTHYIPLKELRKTVPKE